MFRKLTSVFIIMLLSISFIGCSNQNLNSDNDKGTVQSAISSNGQDIQAVKTNEKNMLTLDDIKAKYSGGDAGQIVNITEFGYQYALVEYLNSSNLHWFDVYNLKTGDKDVLPIGPYNVKLQKIISEYQFLFTTDGVYTINNHKYFPQIIECYRGQEITGYEGDFNREIRNLYLPIDQGFNMGNKDNETIADIKVSLKGVEVLFEPMKGEEGGFYADYTTVPPTKTSYDKAKNQFIIEFVNTDTDSKLDLSKVSEQNRYINSVSIKRNGSNTTITLNLKDTAKYYTINFSHLEPTVDDFPSLEFDYANEYKIE